MGLWKRSRRGRSGSGFRENARKKGLRDVDPPRRLSSGRFSPAWLLCVARVGEGYLGVGILGKQPVIGGRFPEDRFDRQRVIQLRTTPGAEPERHREDSILAV